MRFAFVLAALYPALALATFNCFGANGCCMKNHSVCNHQRGCLGSCTACYETESVYCSNCGADCCTFSGGVLLNDGDGSLYTTSTAVYGTSCKA